MGQKVLNKRSVQVINNGPKLPTPEQLEYGELAINYANGHETLAIKNNQNEIVPFSSDEKIYSNVQTQIDNALVPVYSAITDIASAITDDEFVIATALNDLNERLDGISSNSDELNDLILELSGSVIDNYALSSVTHQEIINLSDTLSRELEYVSGGLLSFSATVEEQYATKQQVRDASGNAISIAISSAKTYIDATSGSIETTFGNYATSAQTHSAITITNTRIDNLNEHIEELSGSVSAFSASVVSIEDDLIDRIESALTVVYKFKGSVETFDDLYELIYESALTNGDVYNVEYPMGTGDSSVIGVNFAWVENPEVPDGGFFDELGGYWDLSRFVDGDTFWNEIDGLYNYIDNVSDGMQYFSTELSAFSASIISELIDDEYVIASSLNELNERLNTLCGTTSQLTEEIAISSVTHQEIVTMGDNLRSEVEAFSGSIISEIEDNEYTVSLAVNNLNDLITEINTETIPDIYDSIEDLTNELIDDEYAIALSYNDLLDRVNDISTLVSDIVSGSGGGNIATMDDIDGIYNYIDSNLVFYNDYNSFSNTVNNNISSVSASVTTVSGNLSTLSGVVRTFSTNTRNTINTLSANTHNKINTVSGYIASALYGLSGAVSTLDIYATKAEASEYAAAALANAIAYTDTLSSNTYNAITAATGADLGAYALSANVNTLVSTTSGNIETTINSASGNIKNTITAHTSDTTIHLTSGNVKTQIEGYGYATQAQSSEYASIALSNAMDYTDIASGNIKSTIASLSANTHNTIKSVSGYIESTIETTASNTLTSATQSINSASGNIESTIKSVSGNIESTIKSASGNIKNTITTLSSSTHNTIATVSGNIKSYVDSKVVGVYRYKGSVTNYSDLSSISQKEHGDVYNVENANGNTPAGTNYAWNTGTTSWDALGGSVDLSSYLQTSVFNSHTGNTTIHFTTGDVKSQIEAYNYLTGFTETDPTVPDWAKADTKPAYTASEVGALPTGTTLDGISDGTTRKLSNYATVTNFNSHTGDTTAHVTSTEKSTWSGKQDSISDLETIRNNASSGATAYTNMVTGVTAGGTNLTKTNKVVAIPSASSSTFGVIKVGNFLSNSNGSISVSTGTTNTTVAVGNHTHSGYATTGNLNTLSSQTVNHITSSTLHLPTVSSSDNGKILQVVNGTWALVTPVSIFSGSTAPDNLLGNNGDIYLQF